MKNYLGRRDGWWHFVRRVPAVYAEHDRRGIVKQSTKIRIADDPKGIAAAKVAAKINADLEAYWRGLFLGHGDDARKRFEAARQFARAIGYDYVPVAQLVERGPAEIVGRVEALMRKGLSPAAEGVDAALGLVDPPALKLSKLFDKYEELQKASLIDLSEEQKRRWRNAKRRAVEVLVEIVGDKPVAEVTRDDALDFREHWQERLLDGEVEIGTANKQIGHLNKMWRVLNTVERLGLSPVFAELRIEGEGEAQRAAFDPDFVRDRILKPGAFGELNAEAVDIVHLVAETGLRLSEAVNLTEATIHLAGDVPHVSVEPEGRRMKTSQSRRTIPLVGTALVAMKRNPAGFPRYRDKNAGLSALVNRIMTDKKLRPTDRHSLYSLRHTFEDRLTAIEAPEKVIAALMGHKYSRPKYGAGPSLKQKREWLERIAFKLPAG
ncbi:tyrosine-type recombinase/integrase [Bosea sp. (in: a-proteobacteria)]